MDPQLFDKIFDGAFEHAKKLLQSKDGLMPTGFIFTKDHESGMYQCQVFPMPFDSDEKKEFFKMLFVELAKKLQPSAVLFVSEAWVAVRKTREELQGMVRDQPDRKEAIILAGRTKSINRARTQTFVKEGGNFIFGKMDNLVGEMCGFTDGIFPEAPRNLH